MKGKSTFTAIELNELERLVILRNKTAPSGQKTIRDKMRKIGFYGKDDWGIVDLKVEDLRRLIKSGRIIIVEVSDEQGVVKNPKPANEPRSSAESFSSVPLKIKLFDPALDSADKIDDSPGNYIICLRPKCCLPPRSLLPEFKTFNELAVLYTGIAGRSLRNRDYKQHFQGNNAGRSTLRKSLGVLFGYKLIPRDKDPNSGKTKFSLEDEVALSKWMRENLVMYFIPTDDYNNLEKKLILKYNPPLNIKGNGNEVNREFRMMLSGMRCGR